MTEIKKPEFIPEITINNTKQTKEIEIDGVKQFVEIPPRAGFNIKTRDSEGNFHTEFLAGELEAVVLFDKYMIRSKYNVKPSYFSNEFEFKAPLNKVRAYSTEQKQVLYEGDYFGAKEKFSTGELNKLGKPVTTYDVFVLLYLKLGTEVVKFKWKMNQNCNWFDYKDSFDDKDDGYLGAKTKFKLEKKKFGTNEFFAVTLEQGDAVDMLDTMPTRDSEKENFLGRENFYKKKNDKPVTEEDEINVGNIPF